MQAYQAGNPPHHMLTLQTQDLRCPIKTACRLALQDAFGHRRHIQQVRQYPMAETFTTLGPKPAGLVR
ncbi:hypothetical protein D9M69_591070 [compost metagenome]